MPTGPGATGRDDAGVSGVHVGLDLGFKNDTTAVVPVWRPEREQIAQVGVPTILKPPGDGTSLSVETILAACAAMVERWPRLTIIADPLAGGEQLLQRIEAELPRVRGAATTPAGDERGRAQAGDRNALLAGRGLGRGGEVGLGIEVGDSLAKDGERPFQRLGSADHAKRGRFLVDARDHCRLPVYKEVVPVAPTPKESRAREPAGNTLRSRSMTAPALPTPKFAATTRRSP